MCASYHSKFVIVSHRSIMACFELVYQNIDFFVCFFKWCFVLYLYRLFWIFFWFLDLFFFQLLSRQLDRFFKILALFSNECSLWWMCFFEWLELKYCQKKKSGCIIYYLVYVLNFPLHPTAIDFLFGWLKNLKLAKKHPKKVSSF